MKIQLLKSQNLVLILLLGLIPATLNIPTWQASSQTRLANLWTWLDQLAMPAVIIEVKDHAAIVRLRATYTSIVRHTELNDAESSHKKVHRDLLASLPELVRFNSEAECSQLEPGSEALMVYGIHDQSFIEIRYQSYCRKPTLIKTLDIAAIKSLASIASFHLFWISSDAITVMALSAEQPALRLNRPS